MCKADIWLCLRSKSHFFWALLRGMDSQPGFLRMFQSQMFMLQLYSWPFRTSNHLSVDIWSIWNNTWLHLILLLVSHLQCTWGPVACSFLRPIKSHHRDLTLCLLPPLKIWDPLHLNPNSCWLWTFTGLDMCLASNQNQVSVSSWVTGLNCCYTFTPTRIFSELYLCVFMASLRVSLPQCVSFLYVYLGVCSVNRHAWRENIYVNV